MDDIRFEAVTRVTRESCRAQARARMDAGIREAFVLLLMAALATVIMCAAEVPEVIWGFIVFILLLIYVLFGTRLDALRIYASRHHHVESIHLAFDEKGIRVRSEVEDSLIRYDAVTWIGMDGCYLMLRMRHHAAIALRKDEVAGDRFDDLVSYLREKTNKDVKRVRP